MSKRKNGLETATVADEALPSAQTQREAHGRVIGLARELPASEVQPLNADVRVAFVNALDGHAMLVPVWPKVKALGTQADAAAIARVPDAAAAVLYAERQLELVTPSPSDRLARLHRARQLRLGLLHQAQAAAVLGFIPEEPVERIANGRGNLDTVEDLVALAALFTKYGDTLGPTLATPALIDEAEHLGAGLQAELRPQAAPKQAAQKDTELATLTDERNRLWTLLGRDYAELVRVARFLDLDVPSLQSRRALKKPPAPPAVA